MTCRMSPTDNPPRSSHLQHPAAAPTTSRPRRTTVPFSRLRRIWRWQAIPCRLGEAGAGCPCQGGTGRQASGVSAQRFPRRRWAGPAV